MMHEHNKPQYTVHIHAYAPKLRQQERPLIGCVFLPAIPRVGELICNDLGTHIYWYRVKAIRYHTDDSAIVAECEEWDMGATGPGGRLTSEEKVALFADMEARYMKGGDDSGCECGL